MKSVSTLTAATILVAMATSLRADPQPPAVATVADGNVALASRGATVSGEFLAGHGGSALIDGNTTDYDGGRGYACAKLPSSWVVTLPQTYLLSQIRLLLWDGDDRFNRYVVETSLDGKTYHTAADRSQGEWRSWQKLTFEPRPARYIRLRGLYASDQAYIYVVELEAYYKPVAPDKPQWVESPKRFPHRLVVNLVDGSTVIGTTTRASFPVRHETGNLSVKLRSIVSVTMQPEGGKAVVKLSNGDHFQVDWKMDSVSLQTAYGNVELPVRRIRQIVIDNYTLSREPGAWTVLRTYDYGDDSVTERTYTDKAFSLDETTPKDGTDKNILKEIVYDSDGGIRKVRYPTGLCYEFDGKTWTRTESGAYQDLPNFDLSPYMPNLAQGKTVPIEKVTEGGMTFYRFTLRSPLKKAYEKGTRVAQHRSLMGYTYSGAVSSGVPTRWTKFEGVIRGESITKVFPDQFRRSTKYVRIVILPNYHQKGDYRLRFDALSFSDATRNENLIANHDASQGRQNLQASTVKGDGVGDRVCFEAGPGWNVLSEEYIPVDTMKAYRISGWFRSAGSAGLSRLYYGVACYDAEKRLIDSSTIGRVKDTFTELAIAAKPGDKVLHLKDAGKWQDDFSDVAAAFNVDSTPENTRIKHSTGAYDPALSKWQPDGGEAYYFDGATEPRYVRKKDGTWINNLRPKEKGTYDPIADRWTAEPS